MQKMENVRQLVSQGTKRLKAAGVPEADYDARQLLFACTGLTEASFLADPGRTVSADQQEQYLNMLALREKRIPLQHILGKAWFYGREFFVSGDVLIPRPDTEILVEEALRVIRPGDSVLDVCTGSGCILLTLACEQKLQTTPIVLLPSGCLMANKPMKLMQCFRSMNSSSLIRPCASISSQPLMPWLLRLNKMGCRSATLTKATSRLGSE